MGRPKSYHCAHISHMRLDRMQCLVYKQTPPSLWQSLSLRFSRLFAIPNPSTRSPAFSLPLNIPSTITYPIFLPSYLPTTSTCATPFVSYSQSIRSLPLLGGGDINVSSSSTLDLTIPNVDNTIPTWILQLLIPPSTISVPSLLETEDYSQWPESPSSMLNGRFSDKLPNMLTSPVSKDIVLQHRKFLFSSSTSLAPSDVQKTSHQSIYFDDGPHRYPLWTNALIYKLSCHVKHRHEWAEAAKWLDELSLRDDPTLAVETPDVVEECRIRLESIPWRGDVARFGKAVQLTTHHFASILSNNWLDDEVINAGANWILQRLGPAKSRTRILNCLMVQQLQHAQSSQLVYTPWTSLDNLISTCRIDILFLPLHVFGNHWTLLRINFNDHSYSYADCLHHHLTPPSPIFDLINWWLNSLLGVTRVLMAAPFEFDLPTQQDSSSCGIIALDIIARILLHHASWQPDRAAVHRMEWFLRLSEGYAEGRPLEVRWIACFFFSDILKSASNFQGSDSDFDDHCGSDEDTNELPSILSSFDIPMEVDVLGPLDSISNVPITPSDPPTDLPTTSLKRPHSLLETLSDDEDSDSHEARQVSRRHGLSGPKVGSSWAAQKALRDRVKASAFVPSWAKLQNFQRKVRDDDARAEFQDRNPLKVRCSACAKWITMRALYDVQQWKHHRATTMCMKRCSSGLKTRSLFALGFGGPCKPLKDYAGTCPFPCPGLSQDSSPLIDRYLSRTAATGGGAPSRQILMKDLFGFDDVSWRDLTNKQQRMVLRREETLFLWRVSRSTQSIYAASCETIIHASPTANPEPCSECFNLYNLHKFTVALNRKMPNEDNMKFVPKKYRPTELGKIYLKCKGVRELVEKVRTHVKHHDYFLIYIY